jgi:hypothetical protein
VVDARHLEGSLDGLSDIDVQLIPRSELAEEHNVTVERVSVYREGK